MSRSLPAERGGGQMVRRSVFLWAWRGLGAALAVGSLEFAAALGRRRFRSFPSSPPSQWSLGMPEAEPHSRVRWWAGISCPVPWFSRALVRRLGPGLRRAGGGPVACCHAGHRHHAPARCHQPLLIVAERLSPHFILGAHRGGRGGARGLRLPLAPAGINAPAETLAVRSALRACADQPAPQADRITHSLSIS